MPLERIHDFTGRSEAHSRERSSPLSKGREAGEAGRLEGKKGHQSFGELMRDFAADVNDKQFRAGRAIDQFVTGQTTDVHQVMVAAAQAGIALDLMLEIRNRVLEGYQELIHMQV